jgi:SET domain-containing protein
MNNSKINSDKFIVKKSEISGKGLFATQRIQKGDIIYEIEGHIHEFHSEDDTWSMPHAVSYDKNKWINPLPTNPLRYTNHSCNPNSAVIEKIEGINKKKLYLIALKNIKSEQEIVFDYSLCEEDPETVMGKCRCGNKNCRGEITPIHNISNKIIEKHKKHIPKWIYDSYSNKTTNIKNH